VKVLKTRSPACSAALIVDTLALKIPDSINADAYSVEIASKSLVAFNNAYGYHRVRFILMIS